MLYANGGPVVMVQVENEYGSYGDVSKNPDDARSCPTIFPQRLKMLLLLAAFAFCAEL